MLVGYQASADKTHTAYCIKTALSVCSNLL